MQGLYDVLISLIDFLRLLVKFPLWLIETVPNMLLVINDAIGALPDFLEPVALLGVSLIVVMGIVKIL